MDGTETAGIRIQMLQTVVSDGLRGGSPGTVLTAGTEYDAVAGENGAISAVAENGALLSLEPREFAFLRAPAQVLEQWTAYQKKRDRAERELDRFLRTFQGDFAELLETVSYETAFQKLTAAKDPAPTWVQAQVRLLNVKSLTIQKTAAEMSDTLEALLDRYITAGGADPLRIEHARSDLALLETEKARQDTQQRRLAELSELVGLLLEQETQIETISAELLRQKLTERRDAD